MEKYNYEIIYDYHDDRNTMTFKDIANTYEEAVRIRKNLLAYDHYSNIQIININEGQE